MASPYNPLDKRPLAESVANALLRQGRGPLPPSATFMGAGIYAIYYEGPFEPYRALLSARKVLGETPPIYVGKAIPSGSSTGAMLDAQKIRPVLFNRLRQHAQSVAAAENLALDDFQCRYLTVDDIWIPLGENLLIERFQPLWNKRIRGFGNHTPGHGRVGQRRSTWDEVHPGRDWVRILGLLPALQSTDEIVASLVRGDDIVNEPSEDD